MTTLDDKLLGEKTQNYCSSSEDEREEDSSGSPVHASASSPLSNGLSGSKIDINDTGRWKGYSQNTGPKGVIRDWQLFKEHEATVRVQNEQKLVDDIKRGCITLSGGEGGSSGGGVDDEIEELMSDEVLKAFVDKRMGELMLGGGGRGKGVVCAFKEIGNGDEFLEVVDGFEGVDVKVVVVIYDGRDVCGRLVDVMKEISVKYRSVQFCCVGAGAVGVSNVFKRKGVPAVLVYLRGELVGNYVRVCEEIGEEFGVEDVEEWLEGKGVVGKGGI